MSRDLSSRRRWLASLCQWGGGMLLLAGPASAGTNVSMASATGRRTYTLALDQLEALVRPKFPQQRQLSGWMDIRLDRPRLRLIPQSNRLGTTLDLSATERFLGTQHDGTMDLDYGIRFQASDRTIRMSEVRVRSLDFPAVPLQYQALFTQAAPRLAEQVLDGMVLHEVSLDQLALVDGLGFRVGEVRVTQKGLRVELVPVWGTP